MDTIFMNSENSKTSNLHRLILNFSDKIILKRKDKYITLSNLVFTVHGKIEKSHKNNNKFKIYLHHGTKNLNYLMDHFLY